MPNIALPTSRIVCTIRKYILHARIWAYSCCTSISYRRGLLAQERGASSFYTHTLTKFLTNKCQQASKICSRRKTRPSQTYSLRNRLLVPIAIFPARIFSKQCSLRNRRPMSSTSTAKPSTASRCPYRGHTMRVTRSWRWVVPSSSSATGIPALLSTTSAYAKGLSKIINGRPWRRVPPPRCGHLIEL